MTAIVLRPVAVPVMLPSSDRIIAGVDSSQGGLPLLPWDVLHLVLLHSDPHTLALVSRVSHDLYLAASDMLYKGPVRLSSLQALRMLFCERADGTMNSRLNAQLSLSQIRNLTIDLRLHTHDPNLWQTSLPLSFSRVPFDRSTFATPPLLSLDHLQIILPPAAGSLFTTLHTALLPHLDPQYVSLTSHPGTPSSSSWHYLATYSPLLTNFTRLKEISFEGVIPVRKGGGSFLAGLPRRALFGLDRLVFDLNAFERAQLVVPWASRVMEFGLAGMRDGTVVLLVASERERIETEAMVLGLAPDAARLLTIELKSQAATSATLPDVAIQNPDPSSP